MAARLLFVFAFGVRLPANRFAVGDLGRFQSHFHVVALSQFCDHDLDMLLPGAGEQEFFRLRVAPEAQGEILLENSVDGHADAVFVGPRFRLDRKSDGRFGNARRRIKDRSALVTERVAGGCFSQLCNRAQVSGIQIVDGHGRLPLHDLQMLKALLRTAIEIVDRCVIFHHAG
jgi:hypothetical protein